MTMSASLAAPCIKTLEALGVRAPCEVCTRLYDACAGKASSSTSRHVLNMSCLLGLLEVRSAILLMALDLSSDAFVFRVGFRGGGCFGKRCAYG